MVPDYGLVELKNVAHCCAV